MHSFQHLLNKIYIIKEIPPHLRWDDSEQKYRTQSRRSKETIPDNLRDIPEQDNSW